VARGNGCTGASAAQAGTRSGGDGRALLKLAFAEAPVSALGGKNVWIRKLACPAELGRVLTAFRALHPELAKALPVYDAAGGYLHRANEKGLWTRSSAEGELVWEHEVASRWLVNVAESCLLHERRGSDQVNRCHFLWLDGGEEFEENGQLVPAFSAPISV